MLNGRIRGDSLERFMYCSVLGATVVDYATTDVDPSSINAYTVRQQTPLSDHNLINVYLKWSNKPKQMAAESGSQSTGLTDELWIAPKNSFMHLHQFMYLAKSLTLLTPILKIRAVLTLL